MIETAQEIIKKSVLGLKHENSLQRRRMIEKYIDFYGGENTAQYIAHRFNLDAFKEIPPACFNFTRKFIDRMARIYTLGATRSVNDTYSNMTINKNASFKHIEKMTRLVGTIAVKIDMNEESTGLSNKLSYSYEPVYYFDPIFEDDFMNPVAVVYPVVGSSADMSYDSPILYTYWDSEIQAILDSEGKIIEEHAHNYGFLPFVFTHREPQVDDFFVCGAYDIVSANELVNILLTEANLGLRFSMFGQHAVTGLYSDDNIQRAGSDELLVLPEGAKYEILSPEANVRDAIDLIKNMLDLCAQNNHLSVSFAETSSDRPTSGIALKIKDLERFEDYQDDIELFRKYESDFFIIERQLASLYNINLPDNFTINFNEPEYPKSTQDDIMMKTWELENDLTTKAKLLQSTNKDLSLDEAQSIIDENEEINGTRTEETEETEGQETAPRTIFDRLRQETPTA